MTIVDQHVMRAPVDCCFEVAADVERWPELLPHYRRVRKQPAEVVSAGMDRAPVGLGRADRRTDEGTDATDVVIVEMSAWRDFAGPLRYPTWWVSEMRIDAREPAVHYRHVDGITRGMIVKWSFEAAVPSPEHGSSHPVVESADEARRPSHQRTLVRITHAWDGPAWPLIGRFAWERVIAPHFVHVIASRTLAGVCAEAERRAGTGSTGR